MTTESTKMRLQKYLAQAGVASRRKAEEMIAQGRVAINGSIVQTMGVRILPDQDRVTVNGKPVALKEKYVTYMLNKPPGLICSASSQQGKTIYSLFATKTSARLFSVGRLDKYSEGLLLVTNDGDLAQKLTHPRYGHTKTYDVTINGNVSTEQLNILRHPMLLDGSLTQKAKVSVLKDGSIPGKTTLRFILQEGRNRQIRNMCKQVNLTIHRLRRIRIGKLELGNMKPGSFRKLSPYEVNMLINPE